MSKTFLFQAIQLSQTVLIQIIQFSISTQFSSIYPIDSALSGATTPCQSGPGSNGNEGVLRIPQSSSVTGTSLSDCLVSYPGHILEGSYPSAEMQSVYSTVPADSAKTQRKTDYRHQKQYRQHKHQQNKITRN